MSTGTADGTAGARRIGDGVVVERRGSALLVGLDRPAKHNALDEATVTTLHDVLATARREPCVVVVHSTTPGIFAAGADIAELLERDAADALRGINSGLMDAVEAHPWPTVAAVDGPALGGGCELALACDLRIGSHRARFGQPEPGLGIIAGAGANWRLPQVVGLPLARRMLYTGEVLDAEAAERAGLLDAVHPVEDLLDAAVALAERIAGRSWRALELTKMALRVHRPATTGFDLLAQSVLFEDPEKRERMSAFLAERDRRRQQRAEGRAMGGAAEGRAGDDAVSPPDGRRG